MMTLPAKIARQRATLLDKRAKKLDAQAARALKKRPKQQITNWGDTPADFSQVGETCFQIGATCLPILLQSVATCLQMGATCSQIGGRRVHKSGRYGRRLGGHVRRLFADSHPQHLPPIIHNPLSTTPSERHTTQNDPCALSMSCPRT